VIKTFRTKRDAADWARRTDDEMVRGVYIDRATSERMLLKKALDRYETEVCPTKRPSTARREKPASANLKAALGDYSLAAITPVIVTGYRDQRLEEGLSASTVRLDLALFSHRPRALGTRCAAYPAEVPTGLTDTGMPVMTGIRLIAWTSLSASTRALVASQGLPSLPDQA
jgi:hypothetical protein